MADQNQTGDHEARKGEQAPGGSADVEARAGDAEGERPSQTKIVHPVRTPAAWGDVFFRADIAWTRFETWLAALVLLAEILSLSLWVVLKGLSTPPGGDSAAGTVFRAVFGSIALGWGAFWLLRKKGEVVQRWGTLAGVALGIILVKTWVGVGVAYTSNLLNWYQQASTLTLFGGLRGIGTRLTLVLALLGGSLATARGKHVTIDLVTRFLHERARVVAVVASWLAAAVISTVAAWGFFDHIAIENFGAEAEWTMGQKAGRVGKELEEQWFVLRKQIALDLRSTPHIVFKGEVYAEWMRGREWNDWVDNAGFRERYGEEGLASLHIAESEARSPIVVVPGKGEPRGELINGANLVFPLGLLIIALRFVLRSVLALSGHVSVDPEEGGEFSTDIEEQPHGA